MLQNVLLNPTFVLIHARLIRTEHNCSVLSDRMKPTENKSVKLDGGRPSMKSYQVEQLNY